MIVFSKDHRSNAIVRGKEIVCWSSNVVVSAMGAFFWPNACNPILIKEPVYEKDLSKLMRWCWWMYGKGDMDLGTTSKESFLRQVIPHKDNFYIFVYYFTFSEYFGNLGLRFIWR